MFRKLGLSVLLVAGFAGWLNAQDSYPLLDSTDSVPAMKVSSSMFAELFKSPAELASPPKPVSPAPVSPAAVSPYTPVIPWQEKAAAGGEAGDGAGAADALNASVPLAQLQFQNVFIPESYGSSGYANQFIFQPVLPIQRNPDKFFPYHIVRPTFPILDPVPDPDGIVPDMGGVGDLVVLDAYFHPTKQKGLTWGIGPQYVFPTSGASNLQTGLGEWQLGFAAAVLDARDKDWVKGLLYQQTWSLDSSFYNSTLQPVATRLNAIGDWYIGVGDLVWKLDDGNGNYDLPLSLRMGKVFKAGKQPINIFIQPQFTPSGFTSLPTGPKYGVKLSITFLLPGAEFGYNKEKAEKKACRGGCLGCRHCR